jgi:molybdenum cofactor cytidylyltransferase
MTFALLPAAGKSTRMGRPKLSLPLGNGTVLEYAVGAIRRAGVSHVLVVVGPQVPELAELAAAAGASVLQLTEETADMRASVEAGLRWLEECFHPSAGAGWLLCPADHPTLDSAVVGRLLEARRAAPDSSIVVPTFQSRRGHPALLDWSHVPGIEALPAGAGLNVYLRQHAGQTLEVPVESASVLWDLDTPEDYDRVRAQVERPARSV